MRVLGLDVGERRIGVAISDVTGTLARPLRTIHVTRADAVAQVAAEVSLLTAEDDGVGAIVVGLPVRLDGSPNDQTARVTSFIEALKQRVGIPIETFDERLSSVEAESRLAIRMKSWRDRKQRLDAAAAAVILQDFLDSRRTTHEQHT